MPSLVGSEMCIRDRSNFHVYRSLRLAKQQGFLDPVGISADSGVYFLPNNVLRECFGIVKDRLYGNLKFF